MALDEGSLFIGFLAGLMAGVFIGIVVGERLVVQAPAAGMSMRDLKSIERIMQ